MLAYVLHTCHPQPFTKARSSKTILSIFLKLSDIVPDDIMVMNLHQFFFLTFDAFRWSILWSILLRRLILSSGGTTCLKHFPSYSMFVLWRHDENKGSDMLVWIDLWFQNIYLISSWFCDKWWWNLRIAVVPLFISWCCNPTAGNLRVDSLWSNSIATRFFFWG